MNKFIFTKIQSYDSHERYERNIIKLQQLEKDRDTFTGVHIPLFTFDAKKEDLTITIQSEFIKGHFVGHRFSDVLYKNLVERESLWSFTDYHISNFVKQDFTNKIYCVDLASYRKMEISKRKKFWNELRKNRVIGDTGWGSHKIDCRYCRKTIQEMVDEYTFFGQDVF
mgnify:CR=1 FL=1